MIPLQKGRFRSHFTKIKQYFSCKGIEFLPLAKTLTITIVTAVFAEPKPTIFQNIPGTTSG